MQEIKDNEKVEMEKAKRVQQEIEERKEVEADPQYKQKLDLQVKVLEEADYVDDVINHRQQDIDKINSIMNGIREIAVDFNTELDSQGSKLEDLNGNMESVALNTKAATKELKEANEKSRKNGKCLMIIAVVIIL